MGPNHLCLLALISTILIAVTALDNAEAIKPRLENIATKQGLTADECEDESDCSTERFGVQLPDADDIGVGFYGIEFYGDLVSCQNSSKPCRCIPQSTIACSTSDECDPGERCIGFGADDVNYGLCISCESTEFVLDLLPVETLDDGGSRCSDTVCVSVEFVSHLPADELVFKSHRRASVLCDANNSCATPGHLVEYNGIPMMMKTYCKEFANLGCSRRTMVVNSPRMKRGLRLLTNTPELKFTSMAAKHETFAEERALQVILNIGF